jgi:hypothetical protein
MIKAKHLLVEFTKDSGRAMMEYDDVEVEVDRDRNQMWIYTNGEAMALFDLSDIREFYIDKAGES